MHLGLNVFSLTHGRKVELKVCQTRTTKLTSELLDLARGQPHLLEVIG